ncbi:MAG: hypothetical protein AXW12_15285 [Thalassospira sp. Nap_22]|nr:MAG: hypothetical protein AXW12_15285 [Thalassospira sp. Nap_22]
MTTTGVVVFNLSRLANYYFDTSQRCALPRRGAGHPAIFRMVALITDRSWKHSKADFNQSSQIF